MAIIDGTNNNDTLNGTSGADTINGFGGHDLIDGGAGNDFIDGGFGDDDLYGGIGNDTLYGYDGIDWIFGEDGDDELYGEAGNDWLVGGAGHDYLEGGDGSDSLEGGIGDDVLVDEDVTDLYDDVLRGGDGADFLIGSYGNDTLDGGADSDIFFDKLGWNTLIGGDGDDLIGFFATPSNFFVGEATGGAGRDLYFWLGDELDVLFNGWGGFVVTDFQTGAGGDYVSVLEFLYLSLQFGFSSPDQVGTGFLSLQEDPFYTYNGITYGGTHLYWDPDGPGLAATPANVLTLLGVGYNDLTPDNFYGILEQGTTASETLSGGAEDDLLVGREGSDTLNGGVGADTMVGGPGGDTYYVDNKDDKLNETFTNDPSPLAGEPPAVDDLIDTVVALIDYNLSGVEFVENVTLTGAAIQGTGNELNNVLTGNANANKLEGLAGNDTLNGGSGNDTMVGAAGNDTYVVNSTADLVTEAASGGTDLIQSSVSIALLAGNVEKLTLTGSSNLNGTGNTLANTLTGNAGANVLSGGTGNDTMAGAAGNDTYVVNSTADLVTETGTGGSADLIQSSVSIALLAGNVEKLKLEGSSNLNGTGNTLANTLTGNSGANRLSGGAADDTVSGSSGNDTVAGGSGSDRLKGGTGADKFDFNAALSATTNVDRITDFRVIDDQMRLDNDFFTAFTNVNVTLAQGAFYKGAGETSAHDASDRIIYNTSNGNLYYDADGAGGKAAKLFATLTTEPSLTNADFFIVG